MSTGSAAAATTTLNTAALAANAAFAKLAQLLSAAAAEAATIVPGADVTLLEAFAADFASQASGDPSAKQKLQNDAKELVSKSRHFLASIGHKLADAVDSSQSATRGAAATGTAGQAQSAGAGSGQPVAPAQAAAAASLAKS